MADTQCIRASLFWKIGIVATMPPSVISWTSGSKEWAKSSLAASSASLPAIGLPLPMNPRLAPRLATGHSSGW